MVEPGVLDMLSWAANHVANAQRAYKDGDLKLFAEEVEEAITELKGSLC